MKLIVDSREKSDIHEAVQSEISISEQRNLDVGDFAICDDSDNIIVLLERKTCRDLAASLSDGRYKEQKIRLLSSSVRWKGYIIEGEFPENGIRQGSRVIVKNTYYSILLGMTMRDKLLVYHTENLQETIKLLGQMIKKIPDYLSIQDSAVDAQEAHIKSISTVRKENMKPKLCYLAQLCQIPGVSHKIASYISDKYPNFSILLHVSVDDLAKINLNKRRLGKVLAERIYNYLRPN